MNKFKLSLVALLAMSGVRAGAQTPFNVSETIDINNISATMLVHGDLWHSVDTSATSTPSVGPATFFPRGSVQTINYAGGLWMTAYDETFNMHVAAQTYRTNHDVEFWPGPLDASDAVTYAVSQIWAKVWKVTRWDIQYTRSLTGRRDVTNVPQSILTWPAKGNQYATGNNGAPLHINSDMAPFVDLNGNGTYEPLDGEYPDVPGDEALWSVFNDNGPTHALTHGTPLGVEVHVMAYAYSRGSLIDNVVYYDYTVINKSNHPYSNFRMGIWDDVNIGYGGNDFIGYDATHRMGIGYNGTNDDSTATGGHPPYTYGRYLPKMGITLIVEPNDSNSTLQPAGSFMAYNSPDTAAAPNNANKVYNYLNSSYANSTHLTHGTGCSAAPSDPYAYYIYDGNPTSGNWSECSCGNAPGDRSFILSTSNFKLPPGFSEHMVMAMVVTNQDSIISNGCPTTSGFSNIESVADTAWSVYHTPLAPSVKESVTTTATQAAVSIFPNPAHDRLYIEHTGVTAGTETIIVYNTIGQVMNVPVSTGAQKSELNISNLPAGIYSVVYKNGDAQSRAKFVKE